MKTKKQFKVGDPVVVLNPDTATRKKSFWNEYMDSAIGKTGVIKCVEYDQEMGCYYYKIKFDNTVINENWWYHPDALGYNFLSDCPFSKGDSLLAFENGIWKQIIFAEYDSDKKLFYSVDNESFKICISYEKNKHLISRF